MAITIESLISDVHEYGDNLSSKFSMLWDTLLDDDNGISEEAYDRLVILGNIIDPKFVNAVSRYVDATDGRFYIKGAKDNG
jgi:hypothetical protein